MTSLVQNQWNFFNSDKFSVNHSFVNATSDCEFPSPSYGERDTFLNIKVKESSKGYGSMNEITKEEISPLWQAHNVAPLNCSSCAGPCACNNKNEFQSSLRENSNSSRKDKKIEINETQELNQNEDSDLHSFKTSTPNCLRASSSSSTLPPIGGPLDNEEDSIYKFTNFDNEMTLWKKCKKAIGKFSKVQWFALLGVCYVNCASNASLSILSSFFSQEAIQNHGVSEFIVGFIFGCYAIMNVVFCPVFGKLVPKTGSKRMILAGLVVSSICSFGFSKSCNVHQMKKKVKINVAAIVEKVKELYVFDVNYASQLFRCTSTISFVIGCLVIRGVQAMGCAAYYTGSTVTVAEVWKEDMTFAMALGEVFSGIGMITGPLFGGWLYMEGGFQFPFIVIGATMFIGAVINYYAMTNVEASATSEKFITLLKIPNVTFTAIFTCIIWAAMDFNMPLLSLHMQQIPNTSPILVGIMFLIMAAAYTFFAPVVGLVVKTRVSERSFMIGGGVLVGISFLLIGPSPIFNFIHFDHPTVASITVSMIVLGIGISAAVVPTFGDLNRSAVAGGMKDNIGTYGLVGGVFNGMVFLGEFIGPVIGGAMMERWQDYRTVSSVFAAIVLFVVGIVFVFYLIDWCKNKTTYTELRP